MAAICCTVVSTVSMSDKSKAHIVVKRLVAWPWLQTAAHQVAVEEDSGGAERRLWELEHHAHLQNEVDALAPQRALFLGRHAV